MAPQDDEDFAAEEMEENSDRASDRIFGLAGLALATLAALFPWYVFLNQESFGVAPMDWEATRDLPEIPARPLASVSPLAMPDVMDELASTQRYDPITTATVSNLGRSPRQNNDPAQVRQDFPGKPAYRLLHVANGRALIEDLSGLYIVRIGSVLPDESRLATMEKRNGNWVIITSDGEVISE